VIVKSIFGTL